MTKLPSLPPTSATDCFWEAAFAGPTPLPALALALKEGLIPDASLAEYGQHWFESWITQQSARYVDSYDLAHRPWRQAGGAGRQSHHQLDDRSGAAPRLACLTNTHHDAGLVALFEGFFARGVDVLGPFSISSPSLGATGLEAIMALNMPAIVDLLAKQDNRPPVQLLQTLKTPGPLLGQRIPLPLLHAAACGWQENLLLALLDYGLDPNQKDSKGQTPLFFARSPGAVKALLAAGADASLVDAQGRSAMQNWVQQKNSMPWPFDSRVLDKALGEVAKPVTSRQDTTMLYLTEKTTYFGNTSKEAQEGLEKWQAKMPDPGMPLNEVRFNPGGSWKGDWSAAAWVGLQVLRGELFYYNPVCLLLARPDFLSPANVYPKGKGVSERGLFGLSLLEMMNFNVGNVSLSDQKGSSTAWAEWTLKQAVHKHLGNGWVEDPAWWGPMLETSRAILGVKSTSKNLRETVENCWRKYFAHAYGDRSTDQARLGPLLWEAKEKGALHFEMLLDIYNSDSWLSLIKIVSKNDGDLANALYLLCIADLVNQSAREAKKSGYGAMELSFDYGSACEVLKILKSNLRIHKGITRLSPALDAEFTIAFAALSQAGVLDENGEVSEVLSNIRCHILEDKLPKPDDQQVTARPRM